MKKEIELRLANLKALQAIIKNVDPEQFNTLKLFGLAVDNEKVNNKTQMLRVIRKRIRQENLALRDAKLKEKEAILAKPTIRISRQGLENQIKCIQNALKTLRKTPSVVIQNAKIQHFDIMFVENGQTLIVGSRLGAKNVDVVLPSHLLSGKKGDLLELLKKEKESVEDFIIRHL